MSKDVLEYIVKTALSFQEGTKAPPKPIIKTKEMLLHPSVGGLLEEAFVHYAKIFSVITEEIKIESIVEKLKKLRDTGIICFGAELKPNLDVKVFLKIWDGKQFVPSQDIVDAFLEKNEQEYDPYSEQEIDEDQERIG